MQPCTKLMMAATSAALVGLTNPAHANGLQGTFSGHIHYSPIGGPGGPPPYPNSTPIDGTFSFVLPDDAVPQMNGTDAVFYVETKLTFGPTGLFPPDFSFPYTSVRLSPGPEPRLTLERGNSPYVVAYLTLVGEPGTSFADGHGPATFKPGRVDVSKSGAGLQLGRDQNAYVTFQRVDFASPVPEPELWLMLAAGSVVVGGLRRRSRNR